MPAKVVRRCKTTTKRQKIITKIIPKRCKILQSNEIQSKATT